MERALSKCIYEYTGEAVSVSGVGGSVDAEEIKLVLCTTDSCHTRQLLRACSCSGKGFCLNIRQLHADGLLGMDFLEGCTIDFSNLMLKVFEVE